MRQVVAVHWMTRKVIGPGDSRVTGFLQRRVKGSAVGWMRELLAEAHDNLFWVAAKDIVARLRRTKLGKAIRDMLVLSLLRSGRMEAGRRASGPRAAATSGHDSLGP